MNIRCDAVAHAEAAAAVWVRTGLWLSPEEFAIVALRGSVLAVCPACAGSHAWETQDAVLEGASETVMI